MFLLRSGAGPVGFNVTNERPSWGRQMRFLSRMAVPSALTVLPVRWQNGPHATARGKKEGEDAGVSALWRSRTALT